MACIGQQQRDFWVLAPTKFAAQKTIYFRQLRNPMSNLKASISGEEHEEKIWKVLETTRSSVYCPQISRTLVHERRKVGAAYLPTLSKFSVFLYCRASNTQFSRQNSTKLCRTLKVITR